MAVSGVLLAGACQAPKDITESCASASAAAAKASAILRKEYVEIEPYVAHVNAEKCDGCRKCLDECPIDGAIVMVEREDRSLAEINSALCSGCGCCVAVCSAIDVKGWTLDQFTAMVDRITLEP